MTVTLIAVALSALGAGCGDDEDGGSGAESSSDEGQEYVDAMVAADDETLPVEDRECFAQSFVDTVGVDALEEAGVTPEDMSDSDVTLDDLGLTLDDSQEDAFWSDLNDCADVRALFLASIAADAELSDDTVDCLDEAMDDDLIREFILGALAEGDAAFEEDDQLTRDLVRVFGECPGALQGN